MTNGVIPQVKAMQVGSGVLLGIPPGPGIIQAQLLFVGRFITAPLNMGRACQNRFDHFGIWVWLVKVGLTPKMAFAFLLVSL